MLVRSYPERAIGALFGSEQVSDTLRCYLGRWLEARKEAPHARLDSGGLKRKLRDAIVADIDARTGRRGRPNTLEAAAQYLCNETFLENPKVPALDDAIKELLVWEEGPYVQDDLIQRYAELLSEIDPTILVTWGLAGRSEQEPLTALALQQILESRNALFVPPRFNCAMAEGHLHLGGVLGDGFVLAQLVFAGQWPEKSQDAEGIRMRLQRIWRMLEAWTGSLASDPRPDEALDASLATIACDDTRTEADNLATIDWQVLRDGIVLATDTGANEPVTDRLLLRALADAAARHRYRQAWMCLFLLLWRSYRSKKASNVLRAGVLLLFVDIMSLRREMVMDGNGLRRFTSGHFHLPARKVSEKLAESKLHQLQEKVGWIFQRPGDKAEIKVGIDSLDQGQLAGNLFRAVHAHIPGLELATQGTAPHAHSRSHWHLCVHFNRLGDITRDKLWSTAHELAQVLASAVPWPLSQPFDDNLEPVAYQALPARIIRGLDVAGDENRWPIEWCAPVFRWLRRPRVPSSELLAPPATSLHLSIHAGEDYGHPLSGLRRVEETVRFCGMRAGDRLGHALALGISPKDWLERHGEVQLPVDEHLDNLVWAWREALRLRNVEGLQVPVARLELRIAKMLKQVPWANWGGKTTPSTEDLWRLYRAWRLRRNCSRTLSQAQDDLLVAEAGLQQAAVPDFTRLSRHLGKPRSDTAEGLFILRARHEAAQQGRSQCQVRLAVLQGRVVPPGQTRLEQQEATCEGRVSYVHDHDDADDLSLMLAIQDACIERYARLGLMIETNPSSNVYIGQLDRHADHPIYRWNPPQQEELEAGARHNLFKLRKRPMPVTINTDDPGLIPTTLRMEYHLIHEGAMHHGCSNEAADAWIERIRGYGMSRFDAVH
ncbi:hypothetical protein [Pantoea sp. Cy-639]|uniref:hypothetical protein n=1 Tax=Pantoea sp. Cy-639 TaxID=2608360 RepID=UPI00141EA96E|nr:hypothetical protein [Pantoea sp. Cy-639]NIF18139.1 hypothetical protein [Pantoea sp. Cy-639]